jgi:hypothetical protein
VSYDPYAEKKKAKRELGVGALQRASAARLAFLTSEPRKDSRTLHDVDGGKLGDFVAYGLHPSVRIPEDVFTAGTSIGADAWKLLAYLVHRAGVGIKENMPTRIDTADAQEYLGRRCTVERVLDAMRELAESRFDIGAGIQNGIVSHPYAANRHFIQY